MGNFSPTPITVRFAQVTELSPTVDAGVSAAHFRASCAEDAVQQARVAAIAHAGRSEREAAGVR